MPHKFVPVLALVVVAEGSSAQAQNRVRFELRGGAAFPTAELGGATLGTGFGFEGTVAYRIQPHLSVYAGWDWHRFTADASFAGPNTDLEETGYAVGLQVQHPLQSGAVALPLRAGATCNHIEIGNGAGNPVTESAP